jgi:hypothetical protein
MNYLIFLHVMALPGGTARVVKVGHTTKGFGVEVLILVASAASDSVPSPIRGVCCILVFCRYGRGQATQPPLSRSSEPESGRV